MDIAEEAAQSLRALRERASEAGPRRAVMEMAEAYELGVKAALTKRTHPPMEWTNAPHGEPPAKISGSGRLANSIESTTPFGSGAARYTVVVGSALIYAAIHETGGKISARNAPYLRWQMNDGDYAALSVNIPKRPYMAPTTAAMTASGALSEAASAGFETGLGA